MKYDYLTDPTSYDMFFNTQLHTYDGFYAKFALQLARTAWGSHYNVDPEKRLDIHLLPSVGAYISGFGLDNIHISEIQTKAILKVLIDELSELEKAMYGIEP